MGCGGEGEGRKAAGGGVGVFLWLEMFFELGPGNVGMAH